MANLPEVTAQNFAQDVLQSPIPVVVDFMATWCPPCRMIAPLLERAAAEYAGRVKIVQMDTDVYPETAAEYGVQKIPNVTFFKNGHVMDQAIGYINEAELMQKLHALLSD
jgi:thioredoxin 1